MEDLLENKELKKIADSYSLTGHTFSLIDRTEQAAIYGSKHSYEVCRISIEEATSMTFAGVKTEIPRRESCLTLKSYGRDSFAFQSRDLAMAKFESMK